MDMKLYRRRYRANGKLRRVFLLCSKCGRRVVIDAADKGLYSKEFRKNYVCLFCRPMTGGVNDTGEK